MGDVSPGLISTVTDTVQEEVKAWQQRPLEKIYPIVYLDALVVKVRQEGESRTARSIWRLASTCKVSRKCWDCGPRRMKA